MLDLSGGLRSACAAAQHVVASAGAAGDLASTAATTSNGVGRSVGALLLRRRRRRSDELSWRATNGSVVVDILTRPTVHLLPRKIGWVVIFFVPSACAPGVHTAVRSGGAPGSSEQTSRLLAAALQWTHLYSYLLKECTTLYWCCCCCAHVLSQLLSRKA